MTMNITRLTTYWTTDEAATVIDFLDNLRDILWETYGKQIIQMQHEAYDDQTQDPSQGESMFDDEISF